MMPHGTATRYKLQRCRCKRCKIANTDYQRQIRNDRLPVARETRAEAWLPVNGCLAVECWCQRKIVRVRVEHLLDGLTYSCGAAGCDRLTQVPPP